jgi:hypothetical protein
VRVLDLGVVADRSCSTSITYLTYLKAAGYIPRVLLLTDFTGPHALHRRLRKLLGVRASSFVKQRHRQPKRTFDSLFREVCNGLQQHVPLAIDYFGSFDWRAHAGVVHEFVAENFDDTDLHRRLLGDDVPVWLYTNGGRVPAALLDQPGFRMIHIHPGVVPHVRGSDGLFWSLLMRGRPGMSCFYMNAGIDTGAVIRTREFDAPQMPVIGDALRTSPETVYAALLYAYDPHLRAQLFTEVVVAANGERLESLPNVAQPAESGRNFYWMHPRLQRHVMMRMAHEQP